MKWNIDIVGVILFAILAALGVGWYSAPIMFPHSPNMQTTIQAAIGIVFVVLMKHLPGSNEPGVPPLPEPAKGGTVMQKVENTQTVTAPAEPPKE
jgi:hypothetical protein